MMKTITLVIPCYNEEAALPLLWPRLGALEDELRRRFSVGCELLFVDDGSADGTLALLEDYARRQGNVRYISFSRNFGKEAALLAGLRGAEGDLVAVLDADLQDPPELLLRMYEMLAQDDGLDCVAARRCTRKGEPALRSLFARAFYRLMSRITSTPMVDGERDFRLMSRRMAEAVLSVGERNRFSKGLFHWVGFRTAWLSYENIARSAGRSSWSFWGLVKYAFDGILCYSAVPLALLCLLGALLSAAGAALAAACGVLTALGRAAFPLTPVLLLLLGGLQLLGLGLVGQYIAKITAEVKRRPDYIVRKENITAPLAARAEGNLRVLPMPARKEAEEVETRAFSQE
jgi:glycosyltransferase involved in cell wall biosynthesis